MESLTLHNHPRSGNCYKIRLIAGLLGIKLTVKDVGIFDGTTKTIEFQSKINANGLLPVLQIGDHTLLPESNAAMYYLADVAKSDLIPRDKLEHAQMLQWMFFEQFTHEPNVAKRRFLYLFVEEENFTEDQHKKVQELLVGGEKALGVMEEHLAKTPFFVAGRMTLADIALYAYTHTATEGRFDLSKFPNVQTWLQRIARLPGYVQM